MSRKSEVEDRLAHIVEPLCATRGLEVVDVRYLANPRGSVVRIFIDRPGAEHDGPGGAGSGVSLDDCTELSRALSVALDETGDEVVPGAYHLEVSSPGLDRPLVKLTDFERFAGREVKVRTDAPIDGRRRFHGALLGVADEQVRIELDGVEVDIPFHAIAEANLVYRF